MAGKAGCDNCGAGVGRDRRICSKCADQTTARLIEVPHLIAQLRINTAKQGRLVGSAEGGSSGGGGPKPLPINVDAAAALAAYTEVVLRHAHALGMPQEGRKDGHGGAVTCSEWLIGQMPTLVRTGGEPVVTLIRQLDDAADLAWSKIDRPPDTWYAGPCPGGTRSDGKTPDPCGADLLAQPGAQYVRCRRCRRKFPCTERRDALLAAMRDYRARAVWIASALSPLLGYTVSAQRIYVLVSRGRLVAHGTDKDGHPLYRIGDVSDELERLAAKRAAVLASRVPRPRRGA